MKLSISNIAWNKKDDEEMYEYISNAKFDAIEIAPTRIIEQNPYSYLKEAKQICTTIKEKYNLSISSMQSIWYGKKEKIFNTYEERKELLNYTKKAIDFAKAISCNNLVFGCPKNRIINDINKDYEIALDFFNEIGDYAKSKKIKFSIEPNPTIYNTNFITNTQEALDIVKNINNEAIGINLDLGTIIENNEKLETLEDSIKYINHVHISEPNLEFIQQRDLHTKVIEMLKKNNYQKFISIEMKNQNNIQKVKEVVDYIKEII